MDAKASESMIKIIEIQRNTLKKQADIALRVRKILVGYIRENGKDSRITECANLMREISDQYFLKSDS